MSLAKCVLFRYNTFPSGNNHRFNIANLPLTLTRNPLLDLRLHSTMPDCASCAEKWPLGYPACTGLPFTVLTKVFTSCLICLYSRWLGVDEVSMFRRSTPLLIILAGMEERRVVGWKAPQVAVFEAHRPFKCCAAEVSCHHHLAVFRINSLSCCMKCSHSSTILCSWKIKGPCSI